MSHIIKDPNLIVRNGIYLSLRLILVLIASFYITRLTLDILGDVDYGINNIVGGITVIFAIITMPLLTTIQRFFNVEFAKNKYNETVIFNTSKKLIFSIIILLIILYETIGLYLIKNVINIPEKRQTVALYVYQISVVTNLLTFLYIPYQALLFSKENMGVLAYTEVGLSLFRIILLLIIPFITLDYLISCSLILLFGHFFIFVYYYHYCKKKYSEIFQNKSNDKELFKQMFNFSSWGTIESISGIAINYGTNFILNVFGGVLYNTAYGISRQVSNGVLSFTTNLLKVFDPQISGSHAIGDYSYRNKLVVLAIKISFLLIGFIFIVFAFDGEYILNIWLKDTPSFALEFTLIMMLASIFSSISLPLRTLIVASGKIKEYFIGYGLINLIAILTMLLLLMYSFPIISVMYIYFIQSFIITVYALVILKIKISFPVFIISKVVIYDCIVLTITGVLYHILDHYFSHGVLNLCLKISGAFIFLIICSYLLILDKIEKKNVVYKLKNYIHKI
jgi:O-antigen/teichoic acid export membrane protein